MTGLFACFNSIKVQLERRRLLEQLRVLLFQFHKGAIRTDPLKKSCKESFSFNSIKVQLELIGSVYNVAVNNDVSIP